MNLQINIMSKKFSSSALIGYLSFFPFILPYYLTSFVVNFFLSCFSSFCLLLYYFNFLLFSDSIFKNSFVRFLLLSIIIFIFHHYVISHYLLFPRIGNTLHNWIVIGSVVVWYYYIVAFSRIIRLVVRLKLVRCVFFEILV